ncbi:ABC transporter ATP-binding protein [Pseudoduganella rivuli]|nr:ATP-binding cassette domain-containing protein [Pseudoduganella rivuli]
MLLQLTNVSKSYNGMRVIPPLSLAIEEGEFVGVISPNGAGKSTLFGLISGVHRSDGGAIALDGVDIGGLDAAARCRAGIACTFQIPKPFLGMTVYENVLVAATFGGQLGRAAARERAARALAQCGLLAEGDVPAQRLSLLQRKRLELARAIATGPRLLLLDEVAGGLTDSEVLELLALVGAIHRGGTTVVWIEHLVHALVSVAKRLVVLSAGTIINDGESQAVLASQVVRESYLGSGAETNAGELHAAH